MASHDKVFRVNVLSLITYEMGLAIKAHVQAGHSFEHMVEHHFPGFHASQLEKYYRTRYARKNSLTQQLITADEVSQSVSPLHIPEPTGDTPSTEPAASNLIDAMNRPSSRRDSRVSAAESNTSRISITEYEQNRIVGWVATGWTDEKIAQELGEPITAAWIKNYKEKLPKPGAKTRRQSMKLAKQKTSPAAEDISNEGASASATLEPPTNEATRNKRSRRPRNAPPSASRSRDRGAGAQGSAAQQSQPAQQTSPSSVSQRDTKSDGGLGHMSVDEPMSRDGKTRQRVAGFQNEDGELLTRVNKIEKDIDDIKSLLRDLRDEVPTGLLANRRNDAR